MSDASAPAAVPAHLTYELRLEVDASHLDGQGHVNNVVYVHWVQDVAIAHWEALTTPAQRSATGWVALRHEIDYLHPARLGDAVVVRTRIGALEKLTFERFTEITRATDGRALARARTLWCPVEPGTGRPRRVSADVRALFAEGPGGRAQGGGAGKLA